VSISRRARQGDSSSDGERLGVCNNAAAPTRAAHLGNFTNRHWQAAFVSACFACVSTCYDHSLKSVSPGIFTTRYMVNKHGAVPWPPTELGCHLPCRPAVHLLQRVNSDQFTCIRKHCLVPESIQLNLCSACCWGSSMQGSKCVPRMRKLDKSCSCYSWQICKPFLEASSDLRR
jgi:hypothetical protein